jgi:D-serine deaminase-like pyridoxal phosphate-dependent protein
MQQLATHARDASLMTAHDIAISVVAEVASRRSLTHCKWSLNTKQCLQDAVYPGRGANGTTEALINAGTLALGREPVTDKGKIPGQDYPGWGFLMPWGLDNPVPGPDFPRVHDGWQVGRISQEHGILIWHGKKEDEVPLQYGQRVRVWPNHSCIAGSCFDRYLVVDSRNKGREDEVVDVWPRWRGW